MRSIVVLLVAVSCAVSCAPTGNARVKRWPTHRQEGDARFAELERRMHELELRVGSLEAAGARAPKVDPPESAAPTSAATPPP